MANSGIFVFLTCLAVLACVVFRRYGVRREEKFRLQQEALLARLVAEGNTSPWVRIVLARPTYAARLFAYPDHEMVGFAVQTPNGVRLLATLPEGSDLDRTIAYGDARLTWEGCATGALGARMCFSLELEGELFYVCADPRVYLGSTWQMTSDLFSQWAGPRADLAQRGEYRRQARIVLWVGGASLLLNVWGWFDRQFLMHTDGIQNVQAMVWHKHTVLAAVLFLAMVPVLAYGIRCWLKTPRGLALAFGGLILLSLFQAAVPIAWRIDRYFAYEPEHSALYRFTGGVTLQPLEAGLPTLEFPRRDAPYWAQFAVGSTHTFVLRHGALGYWQHKPAAYEQRKKAYLDAHH